MLGIKLQPRYSHQSQLRNNQLSYASYRQRMFPDFDDLESCFLEDLAESVLCPLPAEAMTIIWRPTEVWRRVAPGFGHHDVVNEKLTVTGRHRVLDMNEDSQRIVVVPVV